MTTDETPPAPSPRRNLRKVYVDPGRVDLIAAVREIPGMPDDATIGDWWFSRARHCAVVLVRSREFEPYELGRPVPMFDRHAGERRAPAPSRPPTLAEHEAWVRRFDEEEKTRARAGLAASGEARS